MLGKARALLAATRGQDGENAAARLLERLGWRIKARNWRHGRLELDLVCDDGDDLVFVEVRTRAENGMVSAAESITPAKRRSLIKAATAYMHAHDAWERSCRFDIICISAGKTLTTEHIRNAFEYDPALDRRYPPR